MIERSEAARKAQKMQAEIKILMLLKHRRAASIEVEFYIRSLCN